MLNIWWWFIIAIWLRNKAVNPFFFIHCEIPSEKIFFNSLKRFQTPLWIINTLLFLSTLNKGGTHFEQRFHIFVQNMMYTLYWYLYDFRYLTHFHLTVFRNDLGNFFNTFRCKPFLCFKGISFPINHASKNSVLSSYETRFCSILWRLVLIKYRILLEPPSVSQFRELTRHAGTVRNHSF